MVTTLNKKSYEQLIEEDRQWLFLNTKRSLERDHIVEIIRDSVQHYYPDKAQPPTSDPPSSPGWISVEDRLPKMMDGRRYSENVLCFTNKYQEFEPDMDYRWIAHFLDDGRVDPNTFGTPTHWMPLLETPS